MSPSSPSPAGKWFVSFPDLFVPGTPPLGGPFDTEAEAREWMATVAIRAGGVAWRAPGPDDAPAPAAERRAAPRRQPALGTVCRLGADEGLVWNLSVGGASLLVKQPPDRDTVIAGELTAPGGGPALPVRLRVAHVTRLRTGGYAVGGPFERRLAPAELWPFWSRPPAG